MIVKCHGGLLNITFSCGHFYQRLEAELEPDMKNVAIFNSWSWVFIKALKIKVEILNLYLGILYSRNNKLYPSSLSLMWI